jgi:hypothetical protein
VEGALDEEIIAAMLGVLPASARAEPLEEWITLGARVHGGLRIGLDALERLKAGPRDVTVLYVDSDKTPCVRIGYGIMLATVASPGQRTLWIEQDARSQGPLRRGDEGGQAVCDRARQVDAAERRQGNLS